MNKLDKAALRSRVSTTVTVIQRPIAEQAAKRQPAPIDRLASPLTVWVPSRRDGERTALPVTNLHCFGCAEMVDVIHLPFGEQGWYVSRVNGDSAYGYEVYHAACCR